MPGSSEHPALQSWRRAERRPSAMKQRCIGRGLAWKGKCFANYKTTSHGDMSCHSVTKSHLTLCNPMNCSLPGSSVHGISQARILEWIAISFSSGPPRPRDRTRISCTGRWVFVFVFVFVFLPSESPGKPLIMSTA